MFTGIITNQGKITKTGDNQLSIESALAKELNVGDSISVNGICLTVVEGGMQSFSANYIPETADKTTISSLTKDSAVNLELPATPSSLLSGHIVQGHIDTIATIKQIVQEDNQTTFEFELKENLAKYIVNKGSITINGVSLTLIKVDGKVFSVGIIPHTLKITNLGELKMGDAVNIEIDVLAKYVEKLTGGKDE
ncbi:MAG: riboflavin synthase [Candidatus Saccharimonadales bacterium]